MEDTIEDGFASVDQSLAWLEASRPALEGLVAELVLLDSHTGDAAGVARVVEVLELELTALGLTTERIDAPRSVPTSPSAAPAPARRSSWWATPTPSSPPAPSPAGGSRRASATGRAPST